MGTQFLILTENRFRIDDDKKEQQIKHLWSLDFIQKVKGKLILKVLNKILIFEIGIAKI